MAALSQSGHAPLLQDRHSSVEAAAVTVLSHCVKRTMTLTQNDLPAVSFDVCVHLHNKGAGKQKLTTARALDLAGRGRHVPVAVVYALSSANLIAHLKKG